MHHPRLRFPTYLLGFVLMATTLWYLASWLWALCATLAALAVAFALFLKALAKQADEWQALAFDQWVREQRLRVPVPEHIPSSHNTH